MFDTAAKIAISTFMARRDLIRLSGRLLLTWLPSFYQDSHVNISSLSFYPCHAPSLLYVNSWTLSPRVIFCTCVPSYYNKYNVGFKKKIPSVLGSFPQWRTFTIIGAEKVLLKHSLLLSIILPYFLRVTTEQIEHKHPWLLNIHGALSRPYSLSAGRGRYQVLAGTLKWSSPEIILHLTKLVYSRQSDFCLDVVKAVNDDAALSKPLSSFFLIE